MVTWFGLTYKTFYLRCITNGSNIVNWLSFANYLDIRDTLTGNL